MKKILVILFCLFSTFAYSQDVDTVNVKYVDTEFVSDFPEFPGGHEAMIKFITENTKYPELSEKLKVEGRVILIFNVHESGKLINIKVAKSSSKGKELNSPELNEAYMLLDQEALRIMRIMPNWHAAFYKNKPVSVKQIAIPITFKLK